MANQARVSRKLFSDRPRSRSQSPRRSNNRSQSPQSSISASTQTLETVDDQMVFLTNRATVGHGGATLDAESFAGLVLQSVPLLSSVSRDQAETEVKRTGEVMIRQTSAGDPFAAITSKTKEGLIEHTLLIWNGKRWLLTNVPPRASTVNIAGNSTKARDALVPYLKSSGNWPIHCTDQPGEIAQHSFPFHIWKMKHSAQTHTRLHAEINRRLVGVPTPLTSLITQYLV